MVKDGDWYMLSLGHQWMHSRVRNNATLVVDFSRYDQLYWVFGIPLWEAAIKIEPRI